MLTEHKFACWFGVLEAARAGDVWLKYHAPLDLGSRTVRVVKIFKNGKLRLSVDAAGITFTADAAHLERFSWVERNA